MALSFKRSALCARSLRTRRKPSLPADFRPAGSGSGGAARARGLGRDREVGELELGSAVHAHGVVELEHAAAARALATQLLVLVAVEHGRDQAEERDRPGDHEPHEERTALDPPDDAPGETEADRPDIPIGSRIIAVCDAFDAMTSDRSYSPRMTVGAALAELERCAGTQFDPDVLDAFMSLVEIVPGPNEQTPIKSYRATGGFPDANAPARHRRHTGSPASRGVDR